MHTTTKFVCTVVFTGTVWIALLGCRSENELRRERLTEQMGQRLQLVISTIEKQQVTHGGLTAVPWLENALRSRQGSWPALHILSVMSGAPVEVPFPRTMYGFCGLTSEEEANRINADDMDRRRSVEEEGIRKYFASTSNFATNRFPRVDWTDPQAVASLLVSAIEDKNYGVIYLLLEGRDRDYFRDQYYDICAILDRSPNCVLAYDYESHYSGNEMATVAVFRAASPAGGKSCTRSTTAIRTGSTSYRCFIGFSLEC